MESKPFSVGARIEHRAETIDRAQYGDFAGDPALGAADYKLNVHLENGRGVYDPLEERTVAQQLEDYPLEKGSATVVYFYRLTCEECIQTEEEFMDTLPEQVEADGKSYPRQVVRINTRSGSNNEILQAFFEAYQVPEEDQMVPIVFTSQGYLAGYEDITQNLLPQLEAGAGLNFQYPG